MAICVVQHGARAHETNDAPRARPLFATHRNVKMPKKRRANGRNKPAGARGHVRTIARSRARANRDVARARATEKRWMTGKP